MADRRSDRNRYTPTYRRETGGVELVLFQPRTCPERTVSLRHTVGAGERLDLLAHRYYGDPHVYWRLVDATGEVDPDALIAPGRIIDVPREDD